MKYIVLLCMLCMLPVLGVADSQPVDLVGMHELQALGSIVQSNYGVLIGLGVAAFGFWIWLTSQNKWGIAMIFLGIIVTAFPGMFEAFRNGTLSVMKAAGGKSIEKTKFFTH